MSFKKLNGIFALFKYFDVSYIGFTAFNFKLLALKMDRAPRHRKNLIELSFTTSKNFTIFDPPYQISKFQNFMARFYNNNNLKN